ncbi:MAG: glycosyltransferase family 39 protein [Rhodocyclaceae bacterium]
MVTPITGDEAYFIDWGRWPDWGFYDHPPMIGWWLAVLLKVSDAPGWLRLPIVIQPAVLALSAAAFLWRHGPERAWLAATLILLAPISLWGVFITTDTPLIYFSFFSALAFIRAARDDDWRFYLLAGLLLGGAFLSKYFSVLLGAAFAAHALYRPSRRKLVGLALVVAGALPGPLLNAWWNMGHCWANIMFNAFNRNEDAALSWRTPLLYVGMMLYVLTPMAVWTLARHRVVALARQPQGAALLSVALVPLGLFAALSSAKVIGLHWVLSFVPFVLMAAALVADSGAAKRLRRFFLGFALLHVVTIVVISVLPLETWKRARQYDGIVMTVAADELLARFKPYERDFAFAADGYSPAVTLGYNAGRPFFVFGPGSSHARHDDILTDLRPLDGRNILIFRKKAPDLGKDYRPYFRDVAVEIVEVRGARFWLVLGRGFQFEAYRSSVLAGIRDRYYAIPGWLPQTGCYFCDRYFPGQRCQRSGQSPAQ